MIKHLWKTITTSQYVMCNSDELFGIADHDNNVIANDVSRLKDRVDNIVNKHNESILELFSNDERRGK